MASDGTTFIDRLESIEIQRNEELLKDGTSINRHYTKSRFHLEWNLGELLFSRQGGALRASTLYHTVQTHEEKI